MRGAADSPVVNCSVSRSAAFRLWEFGRKTVIMGPSAQAGTCSTRAGRGRPPHVRTPGEQPSVESGDRQEARPCQAPKHPHRHSR